MAKRRLERYGKLHPALHEAVARGGDVEVAVWLDVPDDVRVEKSERGQTKRRPAAETKAREAWQRAAKEFAGAAHEHGMEVISVDDSAPVVTGRMDAKRVRRLAADDRVGALFLHEREGIEDLGNSIAIANADDAHTAGFTGRGVNVAVYEDGPDDTTNLSIAAASTPARRPATTPATPTASSRTSSRNAPHGHAPDCNLHSANTKDLDAHPLGRPGPRLHRDQPELPPRGRADRSTLSFDDIYKDWLALHWPYPTICEAAGNGDSTEFVNHKGFNRLTVGNHNDAATPWPRTRVFTQSRRHPRRPRAPEIAANGTGVTAVGLHLGGTSMAAPAVAGVAALIQQARRHAEVLARGLPRHPDGRRLANPPAAPGGRSGAGVDARDGAGALDT